MATSGDGESGSHFIVSSGPVDYDFGGTVEGEVSRLFGDGAKRYDEARSRLVPHLNDFYGLAIDVAVRGHGPAPRVLDLGAGTGLFSGELALPLPNASVDLVDSSAAMLAVADQMLDLYAVERTIYEQDLRAPLPQGPYDIVISALAIHHLPHPDQRDLYRRVREVMRPGGVFVNAEQVAGGTPALDALYEETWHREVVALGASPREIDEAVQRMAYDLPAPVSTHLSWLAEAGFSQVDCLYKRYRFAVVAGWV